MSPSLPNTGSSWGLLLGGEAYQYRVLPFGLAHSPRTFTKCVDAALAPLLQRTTYLGVVWDSTTMQAQLSPARIESILTSVARVREGRSLTVKQFQKLLGLMSAVSNVIPFGLLHMRPLQWWLKTKGVFPDGKSALHDQGHAVLLSCLRHVEETLVLITGPDAGSSLSSRNLTTNTSLTGWGTVMSGHPAHSLWSGRHLTWHIYCLEVLVVFLALKHFLPDLGGHCVLGAPTTQWWFLTSTTREVCVHAPFTGWHTRSLCGPSFQSLQALLGLLSLRRVFEAMTCKSGVVGILVPKAFDTARVPEGERHKVPAFLWALPSFYQKLPLYPPHVLLSSLISKSPRHDVSPIHWTDYTHDSEHGHAEGVPKAFDAASRSLGELGLHT